MKKLLIATTALVATAGMASADITISGHAAAGVYSGLSNKDGTAAVKAVTAVVAKVPAGYGTAGTATTTGGSGALTDGAAATTALIDTALALVVTETANVLNLQTDYNWSCNRRCPYSR